MGEKYRVQESRAVMRRLLRENMKRVLLTSAVIAVVLPVIMIIYSFVAVDEELHATMRGFMLVYEALAIIFGIIAFCVFKAKDSVFEKPLIYSYWAIFLLFSFVMLYIDAVTGSGLFYYGVLLAVISFVPLFSNLEIMYYLVTQAVFIVFLLVRFEMPGKSIADIALMNLVFAFLSRMAYKIQVDNYMLKEKLRGMKKGSGTDPQTGLYNRKGFDKRLSTELPEAIRKRRRMSVLLIDIDALTQYNREFGFDQGDICIKNIGELIKRIVLRNTDIVCRMSGGRFLVLMCGGDDMEPVTLAEKVRSAVERQRIPLSRNGSSRFVTVSVGVASSVPRNERSFSEIYDEADESLYEAKGRGRNITVYDEQIYGRKTRRA